ncbi:MarR family winged helix-turn-helix transcriptional regulator [Flindersiella endophytica]
MLTISLEGMKGNEWSEDSIGRQLFLASKQARAYHAKRLAEAGASFGQWTILATLRSGEPLIQRALAERLGIEGPTLSRYLVQMEAAGLIRRRPSDTDRRAATIELTDAGRRRYQELAEVAVAGHKQLMTGFTDAEVDALRDMLQRIQKNVRLYG